MGLSSEHDIELLLSFALHKRLLAEADLPYARNRLLDILRLDRPEGAALPPPCEDAEPVLERLLDYAQEKGLLINETSTGRDLFLARLMDPLLPRPSEVQREFSRLYREQSACAATDWFYRFCQDSAYIQTNRIRQNIRWNHPSPYGALDITINLSKPEKTAAEIALLKTLPASGYPKCMLCLENVGFAGNLSHPARQNLRTIPLTLSGETWHFQYSPYTYFNEHCIVLRDRHVPMNVEERTFVRLLDFLDVFPHYFIGSNAGLPIVGGSILNHDHFQGGNALLPMADAPMREVLQPVHSNMTAGILHWPMPVVRLRTSDRSLLIEMSARLLETWQNYSDESAGILAYTGDTPHNAVTPIARKRGGEYEMDIVLRNNRASEEHPLGIFHPHAPLQHIKQENIGLIEVMGLFILPGRLKTELEEIRKLLFGEPVPEDIAEADHALNKHKNWIDALLHRYGAHNSEADAAVILRNEVGSICLEVLRDAAVYPDDAKGRVGLAKYLSATGLFRIQTPD